ncbi:MAG: hypothetical protein HQK98_06070 [Nitrospirae bacterium]|nr:hypothetical protein [Nitrospirota bacterium]
MSTRSETTGTTSIIGKEMPACSDGQHMEFQMECPCRSQILAPRCLGPSLGVSDHGAIGLRADNLRGRTGVMITGYEKNDVKGM